LIVEQQIRNKIVAAFEPDFIDLVNESNQHNVPPGSESHFRLTLVTDKFEGQSLVKRHRAVNTVLSEELAGAVHALALHTYTRENWVQRGNKITDSPKCMGGSSDQE